jgi:hypothetical protein
MSGYQEELDEKSSSTCNKRAITTGQKSLPDPYGDRKLSRKEKSTEKSVLF